MKNRAFEYSVAPIAQRVQKVQKFIKQYFFLGII